MPAYMQEYVKYKRDLVYVDLTTGFVGKYSDEEDELSFKKMMEHNLKMLKLLFGEIDKDGKRARTLWIAF